MKRTVFVSALVGAVSALLVGGTVAVATNMTFVLGAANTPDALTTVTAKNKDGHGGLGGPMIQLTNSSTAGSATPLRLAAGSGRPPFTTNSSTRVANLNSDKVDGLDASSFVQGAGGRLLTSRVVLQPGNVLGYQPVLDQAHGMPPFTLGYQCTDDPSTNGHVVLTNKSASVGAEESIWFDPLDPGLTIRHYVLGAGTGYVFPADPNDETGTFSVAWYDGHMATVWVSSYHRWNSPDPRDDGCYVQAMALTK
jgi:hypothetical protein